MTYQISELVFFFFMYSFLGWCLEVAVLSIRRRKFVNPGVLSGPFCPSYGITMVLCLIFLEPLDGRYILQFLACMAVANAVEAISSRLADRTAGRRLWNAEKRAALGSLPGLIYSFIWGAGAVLVLAFLNPLLYILANLFPRPVLWGIDIALSVLFLADLLILLFILRPDRKALKAGDPVAAFSETFQSTLKKASGSFGQRLSRHIHLRLQNAYPPVLDVTGEGKKQRFAEGVSVTKLIWVFLICALLGDLIETVWVRLVSDIWMSRSSVLYGPFSVVWGLGAVLLTVVLTPLAKKNDRYVFLGGFLLGGTYEYMASVFTELVFGQVFWDYSDMPLNIGGRTNVLFMFFWGLLSVVWIKILYPALSKVIERIPRLTGTILTWVLTVLMIIDILLSGLAIGRYVERKNGTAEPTAIGSFLDEQYPDELVEWVWANMRDA